MVLMNMTNPQDKQGYLGNLESKSTAELKDLLARQQKLLQNEKFIQRLQDKGEKITVLVSRIEKILYSYEDVDSTVDLLDKLQLDAEKSRANRSGTAVLKDIDSDDEEEDNTDEKKALKMIVNKGTAEKMITDERAELPTTDLHKSVNSYEKIMSKEHSPTTKMSKFKLHSSLRVHEMEKLPDQLRGPSAANSTKIQNLPQMETAERDVVILEPSAIVNTESEVKEFGSKFTAAGVTGTKDRSDVNKQHVYDEALDMNERQMKHKGGAKLLSLEESFQLQQKHHTSQQELQAKQAAEKLAGRISHLTKYYNPEGSSDMRYREPDEKDPEDEDEEELDYPD